MRYIEQTRKEIIEAYVFLRTNNMTIPSETLEFMKDSSLKALDQALTIPVVVGQSEQLPFDFIKWYSGMSEQKILNAYKRWQKEKG